MKFEDILNTYNIPYRKPGQHHHARPGWLQLDCPFCGSNERKFHLGYNIQYGYLNCWRCGFHPAVQTIQQLTNLPAKECYQLLKQVTRQTPPKLHKTIGKLKMPKHNKKLAKPHKQYLKYRGFSPKQIKKLWDVRSISIAKELQWRLLIPIRFTDEIVSWTTRSIADNVNKKYITAPTAKEKHHHKDLLYGEEYARHAIIITEGVMDVWNIGPGGVATFGLNFSQPQFLKMLAYPNRFICFDNEKEAQRTAKQLSNELALYPGKTYNIKLDSKDPGEAPKKEIKKLRKLME